MIHRPRNPSLLWLAVPAAVSALALADGLQQPDIETLEKEYVQEQARIDVVSVELLLKASKGEITPEEAQDRVDQWMRANTPKLEAQAELAAELDRLSPLPMPPPQGPRELNPHFNDTEKAVRYAALEDAEAEALAALKAQAESPKHLQDLVDEWAHGKEGAALLEEKQALWAEAAAARPSGTEPVVLEVPEDASPEEVEALEWRERSVRRIMDIRAAHPEATPKEMQDYIDERKEEFEEDQQRIALLMKSVEQRRLEAEVSRLQTVAESDWELENGPGELDNGGGEAEGSTP